MTQSLQSLLDDGARLLRERRIDAANRLAADLLARFPEAAAVRYFASDAALAQGNPAAALQCIEALPPAGATAPLSLLRRAKILVQLRRRTEALEIARSVAARVVRDLWQLGTLASVLRECQDLDAAHYWLMRTHEWFPTQVIALFDLAVVEFQLNRIDEAEIHLETLLRMDPRHAGALRLRSLLRTWGPGKNHVAQLEALLASADGGRLEASAGYALAKECEDIGDHDRAFAALQIGARAQRALMDYDSASECAALDHVREAFPSAAVMDAVSGFTEASPIFVVGLPRTGTTLVERILGSHSQVRAVGEITDFPDILSDAIAALPEAAGSSAKALDFRDIGQRYADSAAQLAGGAARFVDKLPYNFLYCGYILAALPNARIVHLVRDPMDTCYAVYKTLFVGAYAWSYDLDEIADYYLAYRRLMQHWHEVLGNRILDVSYEELVRDPATVTRNMLSFCDLPWEDAVLAFHEHPDAALTASAVQVRRPVYTDSVGAWNRVGSHLSRLQERLASAE